MQGIRTFVFLAVLVAVVSAYPFKSCRKNSDCGENACCVSAPLMMKHCQPIGKEGDYCLTKDHALALNDNYFLRCPCEEGLECVPTDGKFPDGKDSFLNAQCEKPAK